MARGRGRGRDRGIAARGHRGNRRGKRSDEKRLEPSKAVDVSASQAQRSRRDASQDKRPPHSFPDFRGPSDRFVDESDPQFSEILTDCYDGFCVERADTFDSEVHENARSAFDSLEEGGVFRTDVTQPFGLGTKCAATYVTRTLVGEPGTTYKYLGLRMFSHPWGGEATAGNDARRDATKRSVPSALQRVGLLNEHLKKRSTRLLEKKQERQRANRRSSGSGAAEGRDDAAVDGELELGSCEFNVALINRMEPSEDRPDLKPEPAFGRDRCSVSWHADSCLEHYSTIAVYHLTAPETDPADWRIALRVEHDAEGPSAGKLKHAGSKAGARAPLVAVALPSRSAYFLLDDFNHHHQHAVLAGQSHRWSSTHRVAKREGHSLDYIMGRCNAVLRDGHRRTLKQWKAEQQALSELEFEWIRQFYVQGRAHYDLHGWWHGPLKELLRLWSLLEQRTEVVVKTLEGASEASFDRQAQEDGGSAVGGCEQRREKKARQKRAKHKQAVDALGGRAAYAAIADALHDRAEKRKLWGQREADKVFQRLDDDSRPMPCPLFSSSLAPSLLPATPDSLHALADAVLEWGKTYSGEGEGIRGGGVSQTVAPAQVGSGGFSRGVCARGTNDGDNANDDRNNDHGLDDNDHSDSGSDHNDSNRGVNNENDDDDDDDRNSSLPQQQQQQQPAKCTEETRTVVIPNRSGNGNYSSASTSSEANKTTIIPLATAIASAGEGKIDAPAGKTSTLSCSTPARESSSMAPTRITSSCSRWETGRFALEMQAPWAKRLLDGSKIVETRAYALPAGLVGRSIELIESQPGQDGISALGDTVEAGAQGLAAVGKVIFSATKAYESRKTWAADRHKHLVSPDSIGYGWKGPGSVHGWVVAVATAYGVGDDGDATGSGKRPVPRMVRRFRSLFEVVGDGERDELNTSATKKRKKRSRKRKLFHGSGRQETNGYNSEVKANSLDDAVAVGGSTCASVPATTDHGGKVSDPKGIAIAGKYADADENVVVGPEVHDNENVDGEETHSRNRTEITSNKRRKKRKKRTRDAADGGEYGSPDDDTNGSVVTAGSEWKYRLGRDGRTAVEATKVKKGKKVVIQGSVANEGCGGMAAFAPTRHTKSRKKEKRF